MKETHKYFKNIFLEKVIDKLNLERLKYPELTNKEKKKLKNIEEKYKNEKNKIIYISNIKISGPESLINNAFGN